MHTQKHTWMIGLAIAAAALPWACANSSNSTTGSSSSTSTGAGGSTTSSSHSASSSSSTAVSTGMGGGGGAGGAADCTMVLQSDPCDDCIAASCCTQLNNCNADSNCLDCFTGNATDTSVCTVGATATTLAAINTCSQTHCTTACAPTPPTCNPITNAGCAAGSACDADQDTNGNPTYDCFPPPPPNTVALCGSCDDSATACLPGSTCLIPGTATTGQCAQYCCGNGDCGSGVCDLTQGVFGVGLCVTAATVDAGTELPACDAPLVAPSGGSCVMGFDGGTPPPVDAGDGG